MAKAGQPPMVVGIVAGEASGDQLGAHLMRALSARHAGLHLVGIGGPKMEAAGAEVLFVGLLPPEYSGYRNAFVFGTLILVLLVAPNGLLGRSMETRA